jgi:hypothetical protein
VEALMRPLMEVQSNALTNNNYNFAVLPATTTTNRTTFCNLKKNDAYLSADV